MDQSNWWTSIDLPDKYTAVLTSDQPRVDMFDFFEMFNMVDREAMESPDAKTLSIGTGPFTFVDWQPGTQIRFAKNNNYWQAGRPYVDALVATVYQDQQSMIAAFEGGRAGYPVPEIARSSSVRTWLPPLFCQSDTI